MKHYILTTLTTYLNNFKYIKYIKRVDNNTLKIEFDKKNIIYFDLTKSNSLVYKKKNTDNIKKDFNAPFDILLTKRFTSSNIKKIYLLNDDKILVIEAEVQNRYKKELTKLQLEFTGKNTNIIILDKNNIILEALRHIDEYSSSRVVKVGIKLTPLEKPTFNYEKKQIDNIEKFLYNIYEQKEQKELISLKKQKLLIVEKEINKLTKLLNSLDNIEQLQENSIKYNEEANNIIATIYQYSGYEKQQKLHLSKTLFIKSKKAKQKAKNQHIEQTNLTQKIEFLQRLQTLIKNSTKKDEIEFLLPKKDKNQTKTKKATPYQEFFIDGYKIMLGRNERENIYLLENSKASDFWFHLKDIHSAHLIVVNSKKTLPHHIIEEASKICAKFSVNHKGSFEVDYTQRRNVKIQSKANVLYNPYNTIKIYI